MPSRKRSRPIKSKPIQMKEIIELGEGYYLSYLPRYNGIGGYFPYNLDLYDKNGLVKQIGGKHGEFIDFPGVEDDEFVDPEMRFAIYAGHFDETGTLSFEWVVQPDGIYYADEEGFGSENDEEIILVSRMNKKGDFIEPFRHLD